MIGHIRVDTVSLQGWGSPNPVRPILTIMSRPTNAGTVSTAAATPAIRVVKKLRFWSRPMM